MDGDWQVCFSCLLECGCEDGDITYGWVAAEVDGDNALGAIFQGEEYHFDGCGKVVTTVDGEDEACFHFGSWGGVGGGDAGEDRLDVVIFGDVCGGDCSWRGAQFQVSDPV